MSSPLTAQVEYHDGDVVNAASIKPITAIGAPSTSRRVRKLLLTAQLGSNRYQGGFYWADDAERELRAEAVALAWIQHKCRLESSCEGFVLNATVLGRHLCLFRQD